MFRVGTGAFRIESSEKGTVRLLPNEHFDGARPQLMNSDFDPDLLR